MDKMKNASYFILSFRNALILTISLEVLKINRFTYFDS